MSIDYKIGCSGFYNKHWKGVFYPEELSTREWLNYYCSHFNTLELNVTFYRFPTLRTLEGWYNKSPEGFLFSVKAPKIITHIKKFSDCETLFNDLYGVCEHGLKEKLACILFQLPPSLTYEEELLDMIIEQLDTDFTNVIEFRHESWWDKAVYEKLAQHGIIFASVSHPKLPETIIANTDTIYVRLHGKPKMFYSEYSLKEIAKLQTSIEKHKEAKKAFVYFNNTAGTAGILNARTLNNIISPKTI